MGRERREEQDQRTVLASLILIITKSTVESGEFSELVSLERILALGNRSSLQGVLVPFNLYKV